MTMIAPARVTFTGLDANTNLEGVAALSRRYPLEWGILFGGRIGKNRYPDPVTIKTFYELKFKNPHEIYLAFHLCGPELTGWTNWKDLSLIDELPRHDWDEKYGIDTQYASRIQVNALHYNPDALHRFSTRINRPVLMQCRGSFPQTDLPFGVYGLHDESGGKGKISTRRPSQGIHEYVGYAGGITPENVADIIQQIEARVYWLDMETGIRTDDWLDLEKCQRVCEAIWG